MSDGHYNYTAHPAGTYFKSEVAYANQGGSATASQMTAPPAAGATMAVGGGGATANKLRAPAQPTVTKETTVSRQRVDERHR